MKRFIKAFVCGLMILLFIIPLFGCDMGLKRYDSAFMDCFDTVVTLTLFSKNDMEAAKLSNQVHERLLYLHRLFDVYNEYDGVVSLKTVNDNAGISPIKISEETYNLIEFAKEVYGLSSGTVNCAMGSVLSLWHDCRMAAAKSPEKANLPPIEALKQAAEHTDINDVILDKGASTVFFADDKLKLDVGAVAKGFAGQLIIDELRANGCDNVLLNLGGNTCALGKKPNGEAWGVAVQNPFGTGYVCTVGLDSQSLVTSGDYQRFFTVDGINYNHIIDPTTLTSAQNFSSVTVLCENSALADALSTALFILSYEEGQKLIATIDGAEALWIKKDGTELKTQGFMSR